MNGFVKVRMLMFLLLQVSALIFIADFTTLAQDINKIPRVMIPRSADSCYIIHGRLSIYDVQPVFRIWIVGTNHLLWIQYNEQTKTDDMPDTLRKMISTDVDLYGDFTVCPSENFRNGFMQPVRLITASNLQTKPNSGKRR